MAEAATISNPTLSENFSKLSKTFGGDNEQDVFAIYREKRKNTPVMEGDIVAQFGAASFAGYSKTRKIYTLFRYDDVMAVLRDSKNFTSGLLMESGFGPFLDGMMITGMDGDPHRQLRGLLQPCFSANTLAAWRKSIIEPVLYDEFVRPLVKAGRAELIGDFGLMFPIRIIYAILGFPKDPEALERFASHALRIMSAISPDPAARKAGFDAAATLYDDTLAVVAKRRAEGTDGIDLISRLIHANFEGRSLDDHQITNFVRMLLPAAAETTTRTFGTLMTLLLERPDVLERIRADRSLIGKAIDESIRYEPIATFKVRECQSDAVFHGVSIPKGSILSLCAASANRDEAVFENAETFDIDRKAKPSFGFGFGAHTCLGLFVAKAEIDVALNAMLDLMPDLRFDPAFPKPEIRGVQLRGPEAIHAAWTPGKA
jgi:cytochrome P450